MQAAAPGAGLDVEILAATVRARLFGGEPFRVGRFTLEQRLGAGGMGVVYLGRDPDLHREVAIKLVRPELLTRAAGNARARMLREAQAMARLRHPNVVVVHEVGEHAGGIYLAMECVRGSTLRGWLAGASRTPREIVETLMQAGRGLAAAHAVGLVHRDFKPDNVLVGDDGRVCVTDFGLATMPADIAVPTESDVVESREANGIATTLSSVSNGGIAGTVAYMAPECFDAQPATTWSDQFSFCIALYEALWSEPPFGDTLKDIATALVDHKVPVPPKGRGIPRRVRRAVLRGLSHDPRQRFPDMNALLGELSRAYSVRRSFVGLGLGATAVAGVLAWIAVQPMPCVGLDAGIRTAWSPEVADAIGERFAATGLPYATAAWERGRARIDGFVDDWSAQASEACAATEVHHAQTPEMLDRRMACLDRRQRELAALLGVLAGADGTAVDRIDGAIAGLGAPQSCGDRDLLERRDPLPTDPIERAEVLAAIDAIAAAKAARAAGQFDREKTEAERALTLAREHKPTRADAYSLLGDAEDELGDTAKAAEAFQQAIVAARAGGAADLGAAAWVDLVFARTALDRLDAADEAVVFADAEIQAAGDPPYERAALLRMQAELAQRRGKHVEAMGYAEASRALIEQTLAEDDPERAGASMTIGRVHYAAGEYEPAIAAFERTVAGYTEILGADHPRTLKARSNLAGVLVQVRRLDEALAEHTEILAARERLLGPDHHDLSANMIAIAAVHYFRKDIPAALEMQQRAIDLLVRTRGPEHVETLDARENFASMLLKTDRLDEAVAIARELIEIRHRTHGDDAADVGETIEVLARALAMKGDLAGASAQAELAVAAIERAHGPTHVSLLDVLALQAELAHRGGEHERAVTLLQRALTLGEQAYGGGHEILAEPRANAARCLRELGRTGEAEALERHAAAD